MKHPYTIFRLQKQNYTYRASNIPLLRQVLLMLCLLVSINSYGQDFSFVDSLGHEICKTIIDNDSEEDVTRRINISFFQHLEGYMQSHSKEQAGELYNSIFIRMQRKCPAFLYLLRDLNKDHADAMNWVQLDSLPPRATKKKQCRKFKKKYSQFYYIELSGDTVNVQLDKEYWYETFQDGTYAKLKVEWLSACEFETEFIESNNFTRQSLSRSNDKYVYQIIDRKDGYYDVCVYIRGFETYTLFKMYIVE